MRRRRDIDATVAFHCTKKQKEEWTVGAAICNMTLTQYISFVLDNVEVELKVKFKGAKQ